MPLPIVAAVVEPRARCCAAWASRRRVVAVLALLAAMAGTSGAAAARALPAELSATGAGHDGRGAIRFAPQFPLWSDGSDKQRWFTLPRGAAIDARDADAWRFPRGTRLWKTFSVAGRPVETRFIERRTADGGWTFASYVWNPAGTRATLAPEAGVTLAVAGAPGGRYEVPGRADCLACHGSAAVPVLGLSALQLAAPGATQLRDLVGSGRIRGLDPALLDTAALAAARSALERAALGVLHGNCAHCHNGSARRVPVRLNLAQGLADGRASLAQTLRSAVDATSPAGSRRLRPMAKRRCC
jgi:hypothetical protein